MKIYCQLGPRFSADAREIIERRVAFHFSRFARYVQELRFSIDEVETNPEEKRIRCLIRVQMVDSEDKPPVIEHGDSLTGALDPAISRATRRIRSDLRRQQHDNPRQSSTLRSVRR